MRKQPYAAQVFLAAILISLMAGCLPLNESRIAELAQNRYQSLTDPLLETEAIDPPARELNPADLAGEQVLHLSGREIFSTDPALAYSGEWALMNQLFIGLTRYDLDTQEFLPAMAESWEISADGLTWTFHLRSNIPWVMYDQDNDTVTEVKDEVGRIRFVTAADFRVGILRILDPATSSGNAFVLFDIQGARDFNYSLGSWDSVGVFAPDESTLVIQLESPQASLDAIAEMPVFSAIPSWVSDFEDLLQYTYGPYAVKENSGSDLIALVRNPFWTEEKGLKLPFLSEIYFQTHPGLDALELFKAGELDALKLYPEEIPAVMADPQLSENLRFTDGTCGYYLVFFNADTEPLNTATTRQAIAAAVNKQRLVAEIAPDSGVELNQYVPPFLRGSENFQDEVGIAYHIGNAKRDALSIELYGFPLAFASADTGTYTEVSALIEEDLETNLGLDVAVDPYPWENYMRGVRSNYINSGIYLMGYCLDYADAQNLWDRWLDRDFFVDVTNMNWSNQQFLDALAQAKAETVPSERAGVFREAEEIILNQDTVIVPLFWRRDAWLVNPKLYAPEWLLYPQLENWAFLK